MVRPKPLRISRDGHGPRSGRTESSGVPVLAILLAVVVVPITLFVLGAGAWYAYEMTRGKLAAEPPQDEPPPAASDLPEFVLTTQPSGFFPEGPDWELPDVTPRPAITMTDAVPLAEEWRAAQQDRSTDAAAARQAMALADRLKAQQQFEDAEQLYRQALELDPTLAHAAYQLACDLALANRPDEARQAWADAIERGFWDYPFCAADEELGVLRTDAEFPDQLRTIFDRYAERAADGSLSGVPVVATPAGTAPEGGWPVVMLLHGYGDSNLSYLDEAAAWTELGFEAVAVPGSIPQALGRFNWSPTSFERTHSDLQAILSDPLCAEANRKQVYLLGFSQGGLHALHLAVRHPAEYAGAVPLSPGGTPAETNLGTVSRIRQGRVWFVHGAAEGMDRVIAIWRKSLADAGWAVGESTHPGGHQFPEDWDQERLTVASFLTTPIAAVSAAPTGPPQTVRPSGAESNPSAPSTTPPPSVAPSGAARRKTDF